MKFVEMARQSMRAINAIGQGVQLQGNDVVVAFEVAQMMFDAWAAKRITIYQQLRYVFPLLANQGGPLNPYTIGLGGDFNVARPIWIPNANLNCLTTTPPFEYPLAIFLPDEYAQIAIKDMASAMATGIFFNGRYQNTGPDTGLGEVFLYPVPNGQMPLELVLYLPVPMNGFADIADTEYNFPPGYKEAIKYQLAKRLAAEFGKAWSAENENLAVEAFAIIQRDNVPIPNLRSDYGIPGTNAASGMYNWRTGTNSRRGSY